MVNEVNNPDYSVYSVFPEYTRSVAKGNFALPPQVVTAQPDVVQITGEEDKKGMSTRRKVLTGIFATVAFMPIIALGLKNGKHTKEMFNSLANGTAIKDSVFASWTKKHPKIQKMCDWVTAVEGKMAFGELRKQYSKIGKNLNEYLSDIEQIARKNVGDDPAKKAALAKFMEEKKAAVKFFEQGFGEDAISKRHEARISAIGGQDGNKLYNEVLDEIKKGFSEIRQGKAKEGVKRFSNGYITRNLSNPDRAVLRGEIEGAKGLINLPDLNALKEAGLLGKKDIKNGLYLFDGLQNRAKGIEKNFKKASRFEYDDVFEKFAEMNVGTAPTDVISLGATLGLAAVPVAFAKEKEDKVSAALTKGFPVLGAFVTMLYGTVKNWNFAKSLIIGTAVVGTACSFVGKIADKTYKGSLANKSLLEQAEEMLKESPYNLQSYNKTGEANHSLK